MTEYKGDVTQKRHERDARRKINDWRPRTPPRRTEVMLPPLNAPIAQVLMEIKNEEFVKWPRKIKTYPLWRNNNKYCEFHKDNGHNTKKVF